MQKALPVVSPRQCSRAAAREYRDRYPNRDHFPDYRVFMRVHNTYMEGVLPGQKALRAGRPLVQFENEDQVLMEANLDPDKASTGHIRNSGSPRSTVQHLFKESKYLPTLAKGARRCALLTMNLECRFCREMAKIP
ncbi:unnamed protein product [Pieris macdunnoughi]|uniref:DUF4817 domain-containing protein n=1 Tax=Pieris macdunnoughi TaxID=345717 RepID=A0A821T2E2_9NEOP|nr:unnamed protein product [Pieris macdunnoughi]